MASERKRISPLLKPGPATFGAGVIEGEGGPEDLRARAEASTLAEVNEFPERLRGPVLTGDEPGLDRGDSRRLRTEAVRRSVVRVERGDVIEALLRLGTPSTMIEHLPDLIQVDALVLYGSRARGDSVQDSDLDLLAVVGIACPSWHEGDVNVSYYTPKQLASGIGTLFGAHLKRDAIVLWDGDGQTTVALEAMGEVDPDRLVRRAQEMSQLFTTLDLDLPHYLPGLLREARYLLRSCLYAQAIVDDQPCFSVRELAVRHDDPELARLLASRQASEPSVDDLDRCLERLGSIIGPFPPSRNGSLEATIVNEWDRPGDLLSMAFLALGVTGNGSDYADVEKILL